MCYVNRFLKVELYFCSYNKPVLAMVMIFYLFIISRFSLLMFTLVSLQPYLKMIDSFPFCCILFNFVSE